ncbi:MAG: DNA-3-methyladenine glycosylase I [Acidimicrobiia bacterium]|nr:DNA-3-methyladenine glycosylase I [Acidimicrobiia bacterium]
MRAITGSDGLPRCGWCGDDPLYVEYHDEEWGRPTTDDRSLFEKVCLEGFQSGLSWITILRKRPAFRQAFVGFDMSTVSRFDEDDVARLLSDPGIIRHQGKIRATINNAARALELVAEQGSLADYFWHYAEPATSIPTADMVVTETSSAIATDLRRRGWKFVGPTTMYAFMQAMGLVNDHVGQCHVREECEDSRLSVLIG